MPQRSLLQQQVTELPDISSPGTTNASEQEMPRTRISGIIPFIISTTPAGLLPGRAPPGTEASKFSVIAVPGSGWETLRPIYKGAGNSGTIGRSERRSSGTHDRCHDTPAELQSAAGTGQWLTLPGHHYYWHNVTGYRGLTGGPG
eukprot:56384-Hanusia_phi.AAC.2